MAHGHLWAALGLRCAYHHLNFFIGYAEHLNHALNAFRHLNAKNYKAYHLDIVIGYPEHLHCVLDAFHYLLLELFNTNML